MHMSAFKPRLQTTEFWLSRRVSVVTKLSASPLFVFVFIEQTLVANKLWGSACVKCQLTLQLYHLVHISKNGHFSLRRKLETGCCTLYI